jgi:hypothetical protein
MMPEEKNRLLALLEHSRVWCQEAEARDAHGDPVRFDDDAAVAWDITGALCRLFGWRRARVLFEQVERHLGGKQPHAFWPLRDSGIEAMKALQDYNDRSSTTFELLRERLESMPVWVGGSRLTVRDVPPSA